MILEPLDAKRQDSKGENDMTRYEQEQIITALRWVNDDLIDREKLIAYAEEDEEEKNIFDFR